jgi:hypothetical protein
MAAAVVMEVAMAVEVPTVVGAIMEDGATMDFIVGILMAMAIIPIPMDILMITITTILIITIVIPMIITITIPLITTIHIHIPTLIHTHITIITPMIVGSTFIRVGKKNKYDQNDKCYIRL